MKVSIDVVVESSPARVWAAWTTAKDIVQWNFALPDWRCPKAEINLVEGGVFCYRMEAKDGSSGFEFEGRFTSIVPNKKIEYSLGDGRLVSIEFRETDGGVLVVETFDAEDEHSAEQQKQGWQCILENFKKHVESESDRR